MSTALGVLSILCILSSFPLRAQQASDFELKTTVTNGVCTNDGKIKAEVISKNSNYTIQSVAYNFINQKTGALVAPAQTVTPEATGLEAGTYKVEATIIINPGASTLKLTKQDIKVTSSYKIPTIAFARYRPSFKNSATGMISVPGNQW